MSTRENVRRLFKPSDKTPAEEAAVIASITNVVATSTTSFAERNVQRMAYGIRWLKALQDVASYAELAFGQVTEEALLDTTPDSGATTKTILANLATLYDVPEATPLKFTDFKTDTTGETEKIASTEPAPPMSREERRKAAREGRPVGPRVDRVKKDAPFKTATTPPKNKGRA